MILYVFQTAVSGPIGCLSLYIKNLIENHNGLKCQDLMGRNFCTVMVRSQKEIKAKAEETHLLR